MVVHVLCPRCHTRYAVADEQVGQTGTCPACDTVARIPPLDAPADAPVPRDGPGAYSAYESPRFPNDPRRPTYAAAAGDRGTARASFEVHCNVAAVAGVAVGGLSLLWSLFCVYVALYARTVGLPEGPETQVVLAAYAALAVLSVLTGIVQISAGVSLFLRWPRARNLGLVSGIVSCTSLWGCCIYPFCLGYGVYSLVVLCGRDAQELLATPVAAEPIDPVSRQGP